MIASLLFLIGLIVFLPFVALWLWLCARILRRAGYSGWWALASFFPPALVALIWLLAFVDWPARGPSVTVYRGPSRPA